jgi:hypothetical protein
MQRESLWQRTYLPSGNYGELLAVVAYAMKSIK